LNTKRTGLAAALLVAFLASSTTVSAAALAGGTTVQGQVTTVAGLTITVSGIQYNVRPGSPAAQVIGQLTQGQSVVLVFDSNPSTNPSAQVIGVTVSQ
jgi:uncharacterized membrane protein AbrB (regulator of aidB expression)